MNTGIVIKSTGNFYKVRLYNGKEIDCKVKGSFRGNKLLSSNPVAIGDIVDISVSENSQIGFITKLHERKNYIVRKASNWSKQLHVIAANIDQAIIVVTLKNPVTNTDFIDRFLATAEAYQIPAVIIFNKFDIYEANEKDLLNSLIKIYENIGYKCFITSAITNYNIDKVSEILLNKISLFSGNSGVGKSSLINKIDNTLNLKIGDISDYHKTGKHTTSYSEMFTLLKGGYLIDTPGIKGFGAINFDKNEIYHFFPEIFETSKNCKYNNCLHINEPECAVKIAVNNKIISLSRYNSYFSLFYDEGEKYRF